MMKLRKPETKAQQYHDAIFNGTGSITSCMQDLLPIIYALDTLGIPSAREALVLIEETSNQAGIIARAFGGYVGDQANGTLYFAPEAA
jgi:hypothetical protein